MKILALETSAVCASAALTEDRELIAQSFLRTGLTHSVTLMPMIADMLKNAGSSIEEVDTVAVAAGPGSFTGVRIGVAAAKGLAWPRDLPCAPCSTLESMAWPCAHMNMEICAVMDARRNQVYAARFLGEGNTLTRLSEDRATGIELLAEEAKKSGKTQILVGDGAELCYNAFIQLGIPAVIPPSHLRWQSAYGVALAACRMAEAGDLVSAAAMAPSYHRLSQAERERLERLSRS